MRSSASSAGSIRGLVPNWALNFGFAMRASPAHTTSATRSPTAKDSVLAIRAGSQPTAWAASSTVALDAGNSITSPSRPNSAKYAFTLSIAMLTTFCFPDATSTAMPLLGAFLIAQRVLAQGIPRTHSRARRYPHFSTRHCNTKQNASTSPKTRQISPNSGPGDKNSRSGAHFWTYIDI